MDSKSREALRQRLFAQGELWITMTQDVLQINEMSRQHLQACVDMLRRDVSDWHQGFTEEQTAWLETEDEADVPGPPTPRELLAEAEAAPSPTAWLERTVLFQALVAQIEALRHASPAGRHVCLKCDEQMVVTAVFEVEDGELSHCLWECMTCGARVRQARFREPTDVEEFEADIASARALTTDAPNFEWPDETSAWQ